MECPNCKSERIWFPNNIAGYCRKCNGPMYTSVYTEKEYENILNDREAWRAEAKMLQENNPDYETAFNRWKDKVRELHLRVGKIERECNVWKTLATSRAEIIDKLEEKAKDNLMKCPCDIEYDDNHDCEFHMHIRQAREERDKWKTKAEILEQYVYGWCSSCKYEDICSGYYSIDDGKCTWEFDYERFKRDIK